MVCLVTRRAVAALGAALPSVAFARHLHRRVVHHPATHHAHSHAGHHTKSVHRHHHAAAHSARLPVVVLDPGHGGKDPGATGVSGVHEKTITLAMAHELRRQLLKSRTCHVAMTRTHDVFIPLAGRVRFAQAHGAVVFLSMHADIAPDPQTRGASVYTLSDTASDLQAAELARRENSADRFGGPRFRNQPPAIANILASLVREETRIGSVHLQHDVVKALTGDVPLLPRPARHAHFMVLRAADVPSVLVEMGCISNKRDDSEFRHAAYRSHLAGTLRRAIERYLADRTLEMRFVG